MPAIVRKFLKDESAVTAVEYGLVAAFIAIFCVATLRLVGTNLNKKFSQVSSGFG